MGKHNIGVNQELAKKFHRFCQECAEEKPLGHFHLPPTPGRVLVCLRCQGKPLPLDVHGREMLARWDQHKENRK